MDTELAHWIPGRLRLRVPELGGNGSLADAVERRVAALPGVKRVDLNRRAASLVIYYSEAEEKRTAAGLLELFPRLGSSGKTDAKCVFAGEGRQAGAAGRTANCQPNGPASQEDEHPVFDAINDTSLEWTGRDLAYWIPLALAAAALLAFLHSAFRKSRFPVPSWYDLFWFAFSTYLVLGGISSEYLHRESRGGTPPKPSAT